MTDSPLLPQDLDAEKLYTHLGDGTCWPTPGERLNSIERKCRGYGGTLTKGDRLIIASVISAYFEIVPARVRAEMKR